MIDALRLVLQLIDLVVNLIKPDAVPTGVAAESVELQRRHAAVRAGGDLQDAVVDGRGSEQSTVEVKTRDPEAIGLDVAGRDPRGALRDGLDLDGPAWAVLKVLFLRTDERVDRTEKIVERAFNVGVGRDGRCGQELADAAGATGKPRFGRVV